eukprot:TRINITY_DN1656_c3_g1_i2.p1 TRINITY_DN1656_c3_g1~~TRINITY_DN1656_c3_g1_i2.p1  ORF type:complete len:348 (+),score=98.02 TRINITY_DN1656_c3_g1_i2:82-1044(+)
MNVAPVGAALSSTSSSTLAEKKKGDAKVQQSATPPKEDKKAAKQKQAKTPAPAPAPAPTPAPAPAAATPPASAKPSLAQIMAEEQKQKQLLTGKKTVEAPIKPAGAWATAATPVSAATPSPAPAKPAPKPSGKPAPSAPHPAHEEDDDALFWDTPKPSSAKKPAAPARSKPIGDYDDEAPTEVKAKDKATKGTKAQVFGGPAVSGEFRKWYTGQLKHLTGNDDPTLGDFLVSLSKPQEVREYIRQYLGQEERVTNFANEFIRQRDFQIVDKSTKVVKVPKAASSSKAPAKQAKGGKKMQKMDPSLLGFTAPRVEVDPFDE